MRLWKNSTPRDSFTTKLFSKFIVHPFPICIEFQRQRDFKSAKKTAEARKEFPLFSCYSILFNRVSVLLTFLIYSSLKFTGILYFTRTLCPSCLPGVHLGILSTTRTASLSSDGATPRRTCT